MDIKETRPHYRYSNDEKQHIKRWGNYVLILLLVAVLGGIYAYLRYDGFGLNRPQHNIPAAQTQANNKADVAAVEKKETAKYDFINDLKSGSGSIFDENPDNTVVNKLSPETNTQAAKVVVPKMVDVPKPPAIKPKATIVAPVAKPKPKPVAVVKPKPKPKPVATKPKPKPKPKPVAVKPKPKPKPKPVAAKPKPKPKPKPVAAKPKPLKQSDLGQPLAKPKPQSSSKVGMVFQVGAFNSKNSAEKLRKNLGFLGIRSQVLVESGQYKVVTQNSNGTERQKIERKLKQEGINYFPRF